MQKVSLVKSPWSNTLSDLVSESHELTFASPFIKSDAVDAILDGNLRIKGITAFILPRFVNGSSDLEAVEKLLDSGARMHSLWNLHANVYLFDNSAIVTSSSLTSRGLNMNTEYGVMITDDDQVQTIRADLDSWARRASRMDENWTESARRLYDRLSHDSIRSRQDIVDEVPLDESLILESLSGWTREVFRVLTGSLPTEFTLSQVYSHEKHFSDIYPDNRNIKAKIRQTLQYLRDMGLVQFVKTGLYRRIVTEGR